MSRYLLLILLNLPFIAVAIGSAALRFKLKKISTRRFLTQLCFWIVILASLILVYPIYNFLFSQHLTVTEPLSLFDVVLITAVVYMLFSSARQKSKQDTLEQRLRDLHQELSIKLSK